MLRNIEKFANSFNMFIKPIRDFNRTIIFVPNLRIQFQFKYNLIIKKKMVLETISINISFDSMKLI